MASIIYGCMFLLNSFHDLGVEKLLEAWEQIVVGKLNAWPLMQDELLSGSVERWARPFFSWRLYSPVSVKNLVPWAKRFGFRNIPKITAPSGAIASCTLPAGRQQN